MGIDILLDRLEIYDLYEYIIFLKHVSSRTMIVGIPTNLTTNVTLIMSSKLDYRTFFPQWVNPNEISESATYFMVKWKSGIQSQKCLNKYKLKFDENSLAHEVCHCNHRVVEGIHY